MTFLGYIKHPGGVLVKMADGAVVQKKYGAKIDSDDIAPHVVKHIKAHLSDQPRSPESEVGEDIDAARQTVRDLGIDLSAVPDNYDDLDEEEASGVVQSFKGQPVKQGQVLAYEVLHGNRQLVSDTGSERAHEEKDKILDEIRGADNSREIVPQAFQADGPVQGDPTNQGVDPSGGNIGDPAEAGDGTRSSVGSTETSSQNPNPDAEGTNDEGDEPSARTETGQGETPPPAST